VAGAAQVAGAGAVSGGIKFDARQCKTGSPDRHFGFTSLVNRSAARASRQFAP
jgi:hypothetical protein